MPWSVRSVRLSMLGVHGATPWALPAWGDLIGAEPENARTHPNVRVEEGPYAGHRLQLTRTAAPRPRVDLVLAPAAPVDVGDQVPILGANMDEAWAALLPTARHVLNAEIPAVRVAVAVHFVEPAPTKDA